MECIVRLRPPTAYDTSQHRDASDATLSSGGGGAQIIPQPALNKLEVQEKFDGDKMLFSYNRVHTEKSSQVDVFESIFPAVKATMRGKNGLVWIVGPTTSGKTYTLFGDVERPGLLPLTAQSILRAVDPRSTVVLSGCLVRHEVITDIFLPGNVDIRIKEDAGGRGTYVHGLQTMPLTDMKEVQKAIKKSRRLKTSGATILMTVSILDSNLTSNARKRTDGMNMGSITFVLTPDYEPMTAYNREENWIVPVNNVLNGIQKRQPSVPYHKAKLTSVLKDSLTGSQTTVLVLTMRLSDTMSSKVNVSLLKFANRLRGVTPEPANTIVENSSSGYISSMLRQPQKPPSPPMNSHVSPQLSGIVSQHRHEPDGDSTQALPNQGAFSSMYSPRRDYDYGGRTNEQPVSANRQWPTPNGTTPGIPPPVNTNSSIPALSVSGSPASDEAMLKSVNDVVDHTLKQAGSMNPRYNPALEALQAATMYAQALQTKVANLESERQGLEAEKLSLSQRCMELEAKSYSGGDDSREVASLREMLRDAEQRHSDSEQRLRLAEGDIERLHFENTSLGRELKAREGMGLSLNAATSEELDGAYEKIQELEAALNQARTESNSVYAENKRLHSRLQEEIKSSQGGASPDLRQALNRAETDVALMKHDLDKGNDQIQRLEYERDAMMKELDKNSEFRDYALKLEDQLRGEIRDLKKEKEEQLARAQGTIENLCHQLAERDKNGSSDSDMVASMRMQVKLLQDRLEEVERENVVFKETVEEYKKKMRLTEMVRKDSVMDNVHSTGSRFDNEIARNIASLKAQIASEVETHRNQLESVNTPRGQYDRYASLFPENAPGSIGGGRLHTPSPGSVAEGGRNGLSQKRVIRMDDLRKELDSLKNDVYNVGREMALLKNEDFDSYVSGQINSPSKLGSPPSPARALSPYRTNTVHSSHALGSADSIHNVYQRDSGARSEVLIDPGAPPMGMSSYPSTSLVDVRTGGSQNGSPPNQRILHAQDVQAPSTTSPPAPYVTTSPPKANSVYPRHPDYAPHIVNEPGSKGTQLGASPSRDGHSAAQPAPSPGSQVHQQAPNTQVYQEAPNAQRQQQSAQAGGPSGQTASVAQSAVAQPSYQAPAIQQQNALAGAPSAPASRQVHSKQDTSTPSHPGHGGPAQSTHTQMSTSGASRTDQMQRMRAQQTAPSAIQSHPPSSGSNANAKAKGRDDDLDDIDMSDLTAAIAADKEREEREDEQRRKSVTSNSGKRPSVASTSGSAMAGIGGDDDDFDDQLRLAMEMSMREQEAADRKEKEAAPSPSKTGSPAAKAMLNKRGSMSSMSSKPAQSSAAPGPSTPPDKKKTPSKPAKLETTKKATASSARRGSAPGTPTNAKARPPPATATARRKSTLR